MLTRVRGHHEDAHLYQNVTVCERWLKFENFLSDMGERPEGTTLDRYPNNKGNYEPGNCRWATVKEQNNNVRHNIRVTFDGHDLTVAQWSERTGIPYRTLLDRIKRGHMSIDQALTTPVRAMHNWRQPVSVVTPSSALPPSKPRSNPN